MTDSKLKEAAKEYVKTSGAASALECNEVTYDDFTDCFIAGGIYERERSKKLVEALKEIEFQEKCYVNSGPEESTWYLKVVSDAIKEYEGVK